MNNMQEKLYVPLMLLLAGLVYLLNFCHAIYQCALVFVMIALLVNVATHYYGRKKALVSVAIAAVISLLLLSGTDYYVKRKLVQGLVLASLTSVVFVSSISTLIFTRTASRLSFAQRNLLSTTVAAVIDGVVMSGLFIHMFKYQTVLFIFTKEVSYKMLYSGIVYLLLVAFARLAVAKTDVNY